MRHEVYITPSKHY